MEEELAPEAEQAYQRASIRGQQKAYVTVRVGHGEAVLEELYIEGKPIREYLAHIAAQPSAK